MFRRKRIKNKRYPAIKNLAAIDPGLKKLLNEIEDEKPSVADSGEDFDADDEEYEDLEEEANEFFIGF